MKEELKMSIRKCIKLKKLSNETESIEEIVTKSKECIDSINTDYIHSPKSINIGRGGMTTSSVNLDLIDIILSGGFTKGAL